MTKVSARETAKKESARLVEQLKEKNRRSPDGELVKEEAYDRLRRLAEQKIVSYST
jgi:hypothetical protein